MCSSDSRFKILYGERKKKYSIYILWKGLYNLSPFLPILLSHELLHEYSLQQCSNPYDSNLQEKYSKEGEEKKDFPFLLDFRQPKNLFQKRGGSTRREMGAVVFF